MTLRSVATLLSPVALLLAAGCAGGDPRSPASLTGNALSPEEQALASKVTAASISAPLAYLADNLLEGRGPGTRGDALATKFIAAEMQAMGLEPGGDAGTFFQRLSLIGTTTDPRSLVLTAKDGTEMPRFDIPKDFVVASGVPLPRVTLAGAEVVFAGYGIVAPEYQWDDYKGFDARGKVVLLMNDDPSQDPQLFAGKTRLRYGRWDYKYEEAARHGAAGCIIIHTTPSAAYGWQVIESSFTGEQFDLPSAEPSALKVRMWATEDASRKIAEAGKQDLDALRQSAEKREFRAVPLGVTLDVTLENRVRTIETANVAGLLRGSDPARAGEAVIFTAHHDHLGVGEAVNGDTIYNGAIDNASGVATILAIARAAAQSPHPRRSFLFLAVAGEEQGLLGSQYYCEHPTFPPGKIAADINMDSFNAFGKTTDVESIGFGKSQVDDVVLAIARAQGRTVHGDAFPEKGGFYRSDQLSFAKLGVPSISSARRPLLCGAHRRVGEGEARRV